MDPNINFSKFPCILLSSYFSKSLSRTKGAKSYLEDLNQKRRQLTKTMMKMLYSFNVTTSSLVGCIMTALKCSLLIQGFNDNVVDVFLSGLHQFD